LGHGLVHQFVRYFRLPLADDGIDWTAIGGATAVVLVAAALGAIQAGRSVAKLHPVEAMRPPAPPAFRHGLLERLHVARRVPSALLMIVRNLRLAPLRAVASIAALSLGTVLCVTGTFFGGSLDAMMHFQFDHAMREDLTVALTRPIERRA